MHIQENFDLKHFNTFHVSARARYFIEATEIDHLKHAVAFSQERDIPFMLIGQGSNLLFREDYPGLVIELNIKGIEPLTQPNGGGDGDVLVRAMCGESWHEFVVHCLAQGWNGLENLSLIPGTVGAAPVQNIGAYGVEVAEVLDRVEALEIATGELITFHREDCEFGYRTSVFKQRLRDQYIICSVTFRLHTHEKVDIDYYALSRALQDVPDEALTPELVSRTVCEIRRSKLPDPVALGNAGSFFWNPVLEKAEFEDLQRRFPDIVGYPEHGKIKVPAAWLIEQCGWKGYREGDVGVHKDHALVLVNYGEASGGELYELSEKIRASVKKQFGIELWPEVRII